MIGRHARNWIFWFFPLALGLMCVAAIIRGFLLLQQMTFLPWESKKELPDLTHVIGISVSSDPSHVHVGDAFTLTLRVSLSNDQVRVDDASAQKMIQTENFDVLDTAHTTVKKSGVRYEEYRYKLQALNVLPGKRYVIKFAPLRYVQMNDAKEISVPDQAVDIVPRFLEDANPVFAPPYGKIETSDQFLRWGMEGIAVLLLCAGLVVVFLRLKKKGVARAINPLQELLMRHQGIDVMIGDARSNLFAIEHNAIALADLRGVSAVRMWEGAYPSHTHTPNPWEELWRLLERAYGIDPSQEDAQRAHAMLGALLHYYLEGEERQ